MANHDHDTQISDAYQAYMRSLFGSMRECEAGRDRSALDTDEYASWSASMTQSLLPGLTWQQHRWTPEIVTDALAQRGRRTTQPHAHDPSHYQLHTQLTDALGNHPAHLSGLFYIQESSPSLPATFVPIRAGEVILDLSAAPGGKTVQLADRLLTAMPEKTTKTEKRDTHAPGLVIANDVNAQRSHALRHNITRTGCYNTATTLMDGTARSAYPESVDHVLLDAPCSGEGTTHKSLAGVAHRSRSSIQEIATLQQSLLHSALVATTIGGTVTYSTCTLNHRENETVIAHALDTYGDSVTLIDTHISEYDRGLTHWGTDRLLDERSAGSLLRSWPHRHHAGGFFVAQLRKTAPIAIPDGQPYVPPARPEHYDISAALQQRIHRYLCDQRGRPRDEHQTRERFLFVHKHPQKNNLITLTSPAMIDLIGVRPYASIGIPVLKTTRDSFRPLHSFCTLRQDHAVTTTSPTDTQTYMTTNTLTLSDNGATDYLLHRDVDPADIIDIQHRISHEKHFIVLRRGTPISITKRLPTGTLKNKAL